MRLYEAEKHENQVLRSELEGRDAETVTTNFVLYRQMYRCK